MREHAAGRRRCPGSGRPVGPAAFGPVLARVPMESVPCMECGQPARLMTVHDRLHAMWPCGDSFAVEPGGTGRIDAPADLPVPLPRRPRGPVRVPSRVVLAG